MEQQPINPPTLSPRDKLAIPSDSEGSDEYQETFEQETDVNGISYSRQWIITKFISKEFWFAKIFLESF